MSDADKKKDDSISFGPDFMSDDIPIFQRDEEDADWKGKLLDESVKVDDKVNAERATKKGNTTDPGLMRLISIMASQAYIFLGAIENPATGTPTPNPEQARESIDCLAALAEKTQGNLSEEEDKLLKQVVSELRMIYVDLTRGPSDPGAPQVPPVPPAGG